VRLIDWDRAGMGPAALDLASFVARLEADALLVGKPLPRAAIDSFIHGYASDAGQRPDALEAWVAAALLRLLGEPFRQRLPDWPARTASLLDRVDQLVVTSESRRRQKLEIPA
jgi:Ser/Thr protein kinase RdoA (MazF antagonist)